MFATNIDSVFTCRVLSYMYVSLESELVWGVGYMSVNWAGVGSCFLQVSCQVSGCEEFATDQLSELVWVVCYKSVRWVGVDVRSCLLQVSQVSGCGCGELFAKSVKWVGEWSCLLQVQVSGVCGCGCELFVKSNVSQVNGCEVLLATCRWVWCELFATSSGCNELLATSTREWVWGIASYKSVKYYGCEELLLGLIQIGQMNGWCEDLALHYPYVF